MNIKCVGLDYDLLEHKFEENCLYVFSNHNDKNIILKEIVKNNPFYNFTFFTEDEFWEKYILTEKMIVKEEKEVIFFYNALTDELKKKLNIKEYFDCIDIAYRYYNFMTEYYSYLLYEKDLENIVYEWQKEKLNIYLQIHNRMLEISKNSSYIPKYLLDSYYELNKTLIAKYDKIIFINKFSFNNKELKYLENIENLELLLTVYEQNYDKDNLRLKELTLKNFSKDKINIVECSDEYSQLMEIVNDETENLIIYDNEKNTDLKIKEENIFISQNMIQNNMNFYLSQTANYRIIKKIYTSIENRKYSKYQISDIFSLLTDEDFVKLFDIKSNYYYISILQRNNKFSKYINLEDFVELKFLDDILLYEKKEDFLEILTKIGQYVSKKDAIFNISYSYFEALTEVNVIDFNFITKDFNLNYLKLFLKYLDKKKTSLLLEEKSLKKIVDISSLSSLKKDNFYLINLNGNLKEETSFFTNNQKKILGIATNEDSLYEKLFLIYSNLENSNSIKISYIKIPEEKLFESPFLAKLIYEYDLDVNNKSILAVDKAKQLTLNTSLDENRFKENSQEEFLIKDDNLDSISVSNFLKLFSSEIEFYLSNKIKDENLFETEIDPITKGNIVHKIMENLFNDYGKNIFSLEINQIEKSIDKSLNELKESILEKYFRFFKKISILNLKENIFKFLNKLKLQIANKSIIEILTEYEIYKKLIINDKEITIKGRVDLVIILDTEIIIIDFKTGSYSKEKEKSYKDQMKIYSLMDQFKEYKDHKIICVLSFILSDDFYLDIDYEENDITDESIYKTLENYLDKTKNYYELGKLPKYSYLKEVLKNED